MERDRGERLMRAGSFASMQFALTYLAFAGNLHFSFFIVEWIAAFILFYFFAPEI